METRVLLIGGPPGAGKTSLARAVAAELGFGSLTVDDLVIAGRVLTTAESHPALHQMKRLGHTRYFTETPVETLIDDAVAVEELMWPAVDRVIRAHAAGGAPSTLDWWLFTPSRIHELAESRVKSVWLCIEPGVLEERERRNVEFLSGSTDPERMLSHFMARSLWRNDLVAEEAQKLGMPVLMQTGEETIEDLVNAVLAAITD